ncbi:hypothetical protein GCG54_00005456 [Colletotrichum gloeosporioides]|uniref:Uncharacterized protein n=1 Tax=Colletotrichum gloeosporioides TaxID=474922 RepID=A0A8H4CC32_COLGL|nr:uncharacterized protein GCG54_00005456 [Colletotrichum gloeosporioides]KAF3801300.1 hypothetical protein GCG54_00005456 [Colletotrichum gloeosporioides]
MASTGASAVDEDQTPLTGHRVVGLGERVAGRNGGSGGDPARCALSSRMTFTARWNLARPGHPRGCGVCSIRRALDSYCTWKSSVDINHQSLRPRIMISHFQLHPRPPHSFLVPI